MFDIQVHAVELGPHQAGNLALGNHYDHITFTDSEENQTFDFPVSLQVKYIYLVVSFSNKFVLFNRNKSFLVLLKLVDNIMFLAGLDF